jgi:hypothetical protein
LRRRKAAAVLGVLILCGFIVLAGGLGSKATTSSLFPQLTSEAIAATGSFFAKLQGAILRGCSDVFAGGDLFDACALFAGAVKSLTPSSTVEEFGTALVDEIGKEAKANSKGEGSACDECSQFVFDIEAALDTNGTVEGIQEALTLACERRLSDPAQLDQCFQLVAQIPAAVNFTLNNFSPDVICQQVKLCPLP